MLNVLSISKQLKIIILINSGLTCLSPKILSLAKPGLKVPLFYNLLRFGE